MQQTDSIRSIKGIGEKAELAFAKIGIFTVGNLLEYYPRSYDVYEPLMQISQMQEGRMASVEACITGRPKIKKVRNLNIVQVNIKDSSGTILLTWFNMSFLQHYFKMGIKYIFRGKVIRKNGILVMEQPQMLTKQEFVNRLHVLFPIYPLTEGLTNNAVTKAVKSAFQNIELPTDYLPIEIRKENSLIEYKRALQGIHFPKDENQMKESRNRIVFDEFFLFALALNQLKKQKKKKSCFSFENSLECQELIEKLPYELTEAQLRVWHEILNDLTGGFSMNRLVQGDVGSGKTILAVLALLLVVKNGTQGAIMVPTEVLAKQHYESLKQLLEGFRVRVELLVGSMTAKEKREAYVRIQNQEADIIVGTHALIQEKVNYANLSLVITDEQHRFGVKQREAFSSKGKNCHVAVMSATPIPRTLAIIVYGDMDISVIDELPVNRLPIKNCVVNTKARPTSFRFLQKEVEKGRQAYVICPMVEESETLELENVVEYTELLKENMASTIIIEYLHGKMKAKVKNDIMNRFANGEIQILVSTTVIEVGINVANASVILIENAERFGLAQLHQLRGRVGRGVYQSYCILVSGSDGKDVRERLEILNESNDGFYIASKDMQLRGPGDFFGIRQSGILEFKLADICQDADLLQAANEAARRFTSEEVQILCNKYQRLREKLLSFSDEIFL